MAYLKVNTFVRQRSESSQSSEKKLNFDWFIPGNRLFNKKQGAVNIKIGIETKRNTAILIKNGRHYVTML